MEEELSSNAWVLKGDQKEVAVLATEVFLAKEKPDLECFGLISLWNLHESDGCENFEYVCFGFSGPKTRSNIYWLWLQDSLQASRSKCSRVFTETSRRAGLRYLKSYNLTQAEAPPPQHGSCMWRGLLLAEKTMAAVKTLIFFESWLVKTAFSQLTYRPVYPTDPLKRLLWFERDLPLNPLKVKPSAR